MRTALLCLLICPAAWAQTEFEVASIKPANVDGPRMNGAHVYPGGRVTLSGFSLKALIATAFHLPYQQISVGDKWMETDEYNLEAKPPESAGIRDLRHTLFDIEDERLREMLRTLLRESFQLKFHREVKSSDVYLLESTGKKSAIRASEADSPGVGSIGYAGGAWVLSATTMPQLAKFASGYVLHAPVQDRTGWTGSFEYRQRVPDEEPNYTDNTDSFLRMLPAVGLRLTRTKGQMEVLVIDHAEKLSSN